MFRRTFIVALAISMVACATGSALQTTTQVEHTSVQLVHQVVQAERAAYGAGEYSAEKHQKFVSILTQVVESEKVLNDALTTWNNVGGSVMPQVVVEAVNGLQSILTDVEPLLPNSSQISKLIESTLAAIIALRNGL